MFNIGDKVRVIAATHLADIRVGKTGTIRRTWQTTSYGKLLYYVRPDHWPDEPLFSFLPYYAEELELIED